MMLDKATFQRTVNFLRKQFLWSDQYRKTKTKALIIYNVHQCEGCERFICKTDEAYKAFITKYPLQDLQTISQEKVAVDHIKPVGSLHNRSLDEAADKIFCHESNLQLLCGSCHALKTYVDNEETKEKKMSLLDQIESLNWEKHHGK